MATLSVLSYNSSPGLVKLKVNSGNASDGGLTIGSISNGSDGGGGNSLNKTFSKITVHSVLSESNGNSLNISNNSGCGSGSNNHVNAIVRKIKDFGMSGTLNGVSGNKSTSIRAGAITVTARKRPLLECKAQQENKPLPGTVKKSRPAKDVPATAKPPKKASDTVQRLKLQTQSGLPGSPGVVVTKPPGTPGRKGLPLPLAVARRNARERNRVKQVNNGFAALRERIPEEVAECFEAQGSGRGSVKKLSKVETLRMAVEYIRSLERLLGFNFPIGVARSLASSSADDSFSLIKDEFDALSPSMDEQFDDSLSNYDMDEYMAPSSVEEAQAQAQQSFLEQQAQQAMQMDLLPNITTLNGLQYIRIPGTNTYQLLTPDIFAGNSNSPPNSSMEDEQYSALMDTNCLSPATSTATTADLHSSPPSIIAATTATATAAAPAALRSASGACVNAATAGLSRSPVPPATAASPRANSSLHHQQQQQQQQDSAQPAMLSPAVNELLLQSCAADRLSDDRQFVAPTPLQPHLQPRMIKQEYTHEADFVSTAAPSRTTATPALIYQPAAHDGQQQQQMLLGHATLATMSPPLDACNSTALPANAMSTAGLQIYYESDHDQNASFYEGVVTFKKEHADVLLDTSTNAAALSDESMIDAIDWWEAHTPKSDGGSVIV